MNKMLQNRLVPGGSGNNLCTSVEKVSHKPMPKPIRDRPWNLLAEISQQQTSEPSCRDEEPWQCSCFPAVPLDK